MFLADAEQAKKLEADKKGLFISNLHIQIPLLAAELKKIEEQKKGEFLAQLDQLTHVFLADAEKVKLEQEKKCTYLDNFKYKFF